MCVHQEVTLYILDASQCGMVQGNSHHEPDRETRGVLAKI